MGKLLKIGETAIYLNVSQDTLRKWDKADKLKPLETAGGHRRYDIDTLDEFLGKKKKELEETHVVCATYARVSSNEQKQKGDLDRQALYIIENIPNLQNVVVMKEVGSGLNDKRKELNKLLEMVLNDEVNKVYITHKDRLTRFGFNYIENVCNYKGVEIVVLNKNNNFDIERELVDDMMNLITSFSGKLYGIRASKNRKGKKKNED